MGTTAQLVNAKREKLKKAVGISAGEIMKKEDLKKNATRKLVDAMTRVIIAAMKDDDKKKWQHVESVIKSIPHTNEDVLKWITSRVKYIKEHKVSAVEISADEDGNVSINLYSANDGNTVSDDIKNALDDLKSNQELLKKISSPSETILYYVDANSAGIVAACIERSNMLAEKKQKIAKGNITDENEIKKIRAETGESLVSLANSVNAALKSRKDGEYDWFNRETGDYFWILNTCEEIEKTAVLLMAGELPASVWLISGCFSDPRSVWADVQIAVNVLREHIDFMNLKEEKKPDKQSSSDGKPEPAGSNNIEDEETLLFEEES